MFANCFCDTQEKKEVELFFKIDFCGFVGIKKDEKYFDEYVSVLTIDFCSKLNC